MLPNRKMPVVLTLYNSVYTGVLKEITILKNNNKNNNNNNNSTIVDQS